MTANKYITWFWNAATGMVTVLAVVLGVVRLRAELFAKPTERTSVATRVVSNWREFSTAGERMGPSKARVTIVEFSDFQCPYCRVASGDLHDLRRRYSDDVAVVYRHFPIHKFARPAAMASECAGRQGAFERFHDLLFAQAESIGTKRWTRFAEDVGVPDTALFGQCLGASSTASVVDRDSAAGVLLGVYGTPTFLINELMVIGNPGSEQLSGYVKAAVLKSHAISRQ